MVTLHQAIQEKKFDTRIVEKNVARGSVDASEVEKHLSQLPDDAQNAEYVSIESLVDDQDSKNS